MNAQNNIIPMRPLETAPQWLHWSESIPVSVACRLSGRSGETVRQWCKVYGIGVQVGKNTSWRVSRPALLALLDGEKAKPALVAILQGDRNNPEARSYYGA